jgi:hypothetical protein
MAAGHQVAARAIGGSHMSIAHLGVSREIPATAGGGGVASLMIHVANATWPY